MIDEPTVTDRAVLDAYRGVRVLLLGASGFIGRWVARALTEAHADLVLPVRRREAAEPLLTRWGVCGTLIDADLTEDDALAHVCVRANPSITFNLAGYGVDPGDRDEDMAYLVNARLIERLARRLAGQIDDRWPGSHLVHAGSALEYGEVAGAVSEHTPPNPTTLYGRSKLLGTGLLEETCRRSGLRGLTARLFMVYGAGEREGRLLPELICRAASGGDVQLTSGEQRRDFTYVEEVAEGLLRLGLVGDASGTVNLATGRLTRVRDVAELAAAQLAMSPERLRFGALPTRADEMGGVTEVCVGRLRRLTGWTPATPPDEGVRRMLRRHAELVATR